MFEMNLPALQNDLEELQTLRRELNAQAEELDAFCGQLPQTFQQPELVRQLQKQQRDLVGEADQALQLCRALEQIAGLVSRTETRLAQRPDTLNLKLEFMPPVETELRLENQTRGIRITW